MVKVIYKNVKIELLNAIALSVVAILTVVYLFMANNTAMANYQKTILTKNINSIRMEIRAFNLELTDKRSISFLKKASQDLNLVVSDSIQYIKIAGPVAKNP